MKTGPNTLASNKKAFHNYFIEDKYEAGVALIGCEVKSIRQGKASLLDAYAFVHAGELWLENCYIPPFMQANTHTEIDPRRRRKLLLHKKEIKRLIGKTQEKGMTLIPLRLYFKGNRIKLEIGLAKAKKMHDKRAVLKEKAIQRDLERRH